MPDNTTPVLVYNRIETNIRKTRVLLAAFALVLLPVVSAGAVIVLPGVALAGGVIAFAVYGPALQARLESLDASIAVGPSSQMPGLLDLPRPVLLIIGGALLVALALAVLALISVSAFLISRYGARVVLRLAHARPVGAEDEPELFRAVENLCIGSGLAMPRLHVVDADAPNAFATGLEARDASLVVTRGLLTIMNRRELEGVIAHELSHIGNNDIRLSTTLSALVGTLSLPWRIGAAPFTFAFSIHQMFGWAALVVGLMFSLSFVEGLWNEIGVLLSDDVAQELPVFLRWWAAHAMLTPVYAVLVAPMVGLVIRQAVSRQREFLADADAALLTRDPEGLASALVKIGISHGHLAVGEGSAHLYFADPYSDRSLLHRVFPSHPPVEARIAMLARMGSGIENRSLALAQKPPL